jgi:hypothetical protein
MRQAFALGFLLGILSAFGFLTFGTPGLVILLIGIIWSMRYTSGASLSGLLIGGGGMVLALLTWAAARCAASNQSVPGRESSCTAPDSSLLIMFAAIAVAAGVATGFLAIGRRRSRPPLSG